MALRANIFTADYFLFIDRVANLNHYQGFVRWQLGQARAGLLRGLEHFRKKGWDPNAYLSGHRLSIANIFHDGEYVTRAPVEGRVSKGDDVLLMSEEMERRFNSFILVSAFEDFEHYLKSVFGKLLNQLRGEVVLHQKRMFHRSLPKAKEREGTPDYFNDYARWTCRRDCDEALAEFAKQLDCDRITFSPLYNMTFEESVRSIAFCRHCIVHAGGRVSEPRFKSLTNPEQAFVGLCIHNTLHGNDILILPPTAVIDSMFEGLVSYAWALYILLADRCKMVDDTPYFRNPDTGERKVKPH